MKTIPIPQIVSAFAFTGLLFFGAGCVSTAYRPNNSQDNAKMTVSRAREQLEESLGKAYISKKEVSVTKDGFQVYYGFTWTETPIYWINKTFSYNFRDLDDVSVLKLP